MPLFESLLRNVNLDHEQVGCGGWRRAHSSAAGGDGCVGGPWRAPDTSVTSASRSLPTTGRVWPARVATGGSGCPSR